MHFVIEGKQERQYKIIVKSQQKRWAPSEKNKLWSS